MKLLKAMSGKSIPTIILVASAALFGRAAHAETVNCTAITSLPSTISSSGIYCLTGNLSTSIPSGAAINIATDNVVLDLNGFAIDGSSAGSSSTTHGIAAYGRSNITVRNGAVIGFLRGVVLHSVTPPYEDSRAHIVEDLRVMRNTFAGILLTGTGSVIRRNMVVRTGGTSVYPDYTVYGIQVAGDGNLISDNRLMDTNALLSGGTAAARGIYVYNTAGSAVRENSVSYTQANAASIGVQVSTTGAGLVRGNVVQDADTGVWMNSASSKYMDNLTDDVTTAFTSGTAVGHNN